MIVTAEMAVFFVDLIVKPEAKPIRDVINPELLKDRPKEQVNHQAPKVNLSDNIQKFDKKPRVYTENPFSYNSISLNKNRENPTPTASQMIVDPIYNQAAKALGVDTVHDWNRYYDKVAAIVEWAKKETGYKDPEKLASWIYSEVKKTPAMGTKKIDDLYIYSRLKKPTVVAKPKTIIKKVYVKEKLSQNDMVKRLIQGL